MNRNVKKQPTIDDRMKRGDREVPITGMIDISVKIALDKYCIKTGKKKSFVINQALKALLIQD